MNRKENINHYRRWLDKSKHMLHHEVLVFCQCGKSSFLQPKWNQPPFFHFPFSREDRNVRPLRSCEKINVWKKITDAIMPFFTWKKVESKCKPGYCSGNAWRICCGHVFLSKKKKRTKSDSTQMRSHEETDQKHSHEVYRKPHSRLRSHRLVLIRREASDTSANIAKNMAKVLFDWGYCLTFPEGGDSKRDTGFYSWRGFTHMEKAEVCT